MDSATQQKSLITTRSSSINWTPALLNRLVRAEYALGRLAGVVSQFPGLQLLSRVFTLKAAVDLARCAGSSASFNDCLMDAAGLPTSICPEDQITINRTLVTLKYGMRRLTALPFSVESVNALYEKLAPTAQSGTISIASGPLPSLISHALSFLQQLVTQPYPQHNDQFARLLLELTIMADRQLPCPLVNLSSYFERSTDQYHSALSNVSANKDTEEWLSYFFLGVANQSEQATMSIVAIWQQLSAWSDQRQTSSKGLPGKIISLLAANPYLCAKSVAKKFNVAFTTAQRAIAELESLGILVPLNSNKRNRAYCAQTIVEALNLPAQPLKI